MEEKSTPRWKESIRQPWHEFLDKGFQGASLRQIVKNAGVTTGAFYGYFSSKEALFASIVEPHAGCFDGAGSWRRRLPLPSCRSRNSRSTWGWSPASA